MLEISAASPDRAKQATQPKTPQMQDLANAQGADFSALLLQPNEAKNSALEERIAALVTEITRVVRGEWSSEMSVRDRFAQTMEDARHPFGRLLRQMDELRALKQEALELSGQAEQQTGEVGNLADLKTAVAEIDAAIARLQRQVQEMVEAKTKDAG